MPPPDRQGRPMGKSESSSDRPVLYGNWRQPARAGLGRLSGAATAVLFVVLIVTVVVQASFGLVPAFCTALVSSGFLLVLIKKDRHGATVLQRIGERMMFRRARKRGFTLYRSGPAGKSPWGTCQLPGVLASTRLAEFSDSWDRRFGVVAMPRVGSFAVVLGCQPDGASLVDQEQIDLWVARWGMWLASLGQEQGLVGAQVVVETSPDSGTRLRQEIEANLVEDAPAVARQVMDEIQASYPSGTAAIRVFITLTYKSAARSGGQSRKVNEFGHDMSSRLPGLTASLAGTGAGVVWPLNADDIRRAVRIAYDPAAQSLFDAADLAGQTVDLSWSDCGPSGAEASWDRYVHDSGVSMTWTMSQAPKGMVQSDLLTRLIAPSDEIERKRVTLMLRPVSAARAAELVESDVNAARARAANMRRPSAQAQVEQAKAERSAQEEAQGAGVENFGMIITATGRPSTDMDEIRATVEDLAASTRIQIRPAYGAQDAAFAAGLPLGIVPLRHSRVSEAVREAL